MRPVHEPDLPLPRWRFLQARLDKYLDDAALGEVTPVRIVHGKGTGALREAIHAYLRQHPLVKSFHLAELNAGGEGVTVAHLSVENG